ASLLERLEVRPLDCFVPTLALTMSTSALRKRSREADESNDDEPQPSKKRESMEDEQDLLHAVAGLEETVQLGLDMVSSLHTIAANSQKNSSQSSKLVNHLELLQSRFSFLAKTCGEIKPDCHEFPTDILTAFELDFPEPPPALIEIFSERTNQLDSVITLSKAFIERQMCPPSANSYAQSMTWPAWQKRSTAILNLRPSQNQGLPISILHNIFSGFRAFMADPPPKTDNLPAAYQTAYNICLRMADSFSDAEARRNDFQNHLMQFFGRYMHFENDFAIDPNLSGWNPSIGDSAIYWGSSLVGPVLILAGGFYDGRSTVVEPLTSPYLMLPDHNRERPDKLAHLLLAMEQALESLKRLWNETQHMYMPPATPRIYPQFTDLNGRLFHLKFTKRVPGSHPDANLLFLATMAPSSSIQPEKKVFVKILAGDRYGTIAQQKMADAGYAPMLYGVAKVKGAPTAYIMEYLSPEQGWRNVHEYVAKSRGGLSLSDFDDLHKAMTEANVVHGDLRPNNIMVRETDNDGFEFKMIDFDSSGLSGEVEYPLLRNRNIPWPDEAGKPILLGHDRTMLRRSFDELLSRLQ
ncbi:12629_t:CDS:2, partial [Acaulospora colombiana]